jgi:hypothetical protein
MRELGRKGGRGRRKPNPERVHQNLREYLRENVEPAEVWAALKLAMEGQNESARVAASRVLLDALHEPHVKEDQGQRQAEAAGAREKLARLLEARASRTSRGRELRDVLYELADEMREEAVAEHPDLVSGEFSVGELTPERWERFLEGLAEVGLVAPRSEVARELLATEVVHERAEQLAQERLKVLKSEHGIPA